MSLHAKQGTWARVMEHGEETLIPLEYVLSSQQVTETVTGWCARYSANGYMDCTDWCGPYPTRAEAERECREMFGNDDEESDD